MGANAADTRTAAAMQKIIDGGIVKYPKSTAKIKFMVQAIQGRRIHILFVIMFKEIFLRGMSHGTGQD